MVWRLGNDERRGRGVEDETIAKVGTMVWIMGPWYGGWDHGVEVGTAWVPCVPKPCPADSLGISNALMSQPFDGFRAQGVVFMMGAAFWTIEALYCLWCLKDAFLFFRGKGGVEQAKQDAAVAAFRAGLQQGSANQR